MYRAGAREQAGLCSRLAQTLALRKTPAPSPSTEDRPPRAWIAVPWRRVDRNLHNLRVKLTIFYSARRELHNGVSYAL